MNNNNVSKLNIQFLDHNKTYNTCLFDVKHAENLDIKRITVGGRQYFYEEDVEIPSCVNNLLKSLPEDKIFKTEKKLVSYISKKTEISEMSVTNDIYEIGKDRLLGRTWADSNLLEKSKNELCSKLEKCKSNDKETILTLINQSKPPLNQPKTIFEISYQIEENGNLELARSIRAAIRPFDLNEVIKNVPRLIKDHYIDPEKGELLAENLKSLFETGKYDKFYDRMEFIDQLSLDLKDIGNDRHLEIVDPRVIEEGNRSGSQVVRSPVASSYVQNDIGYFELTKFKDFNDKLDDQMDALLEVKQALTQMRAADPKAIIIDLRKNGGGSMYMMAYIASHFMNPDQELGNNVYRDKIAPDELRSFPTDPVKTLSESELPLDNRMLNQPIFILTSNVSLSAAEALIYHLKEHRQATIVGEKTGGGAHVSKLFEVSSDFFLGVSFGDYVLKSGEPNWEAKGLRPDIEIKAEAAQVAAEQQILRR